MRDTIFCSVAAGPTLPKGLPDFLTKAIDTIEVLQKSRHRTYFQLVFILEENGKIGSHTEVYKHPLLQPFNRIKISVIFQSIPYMLFDGLITHIHYNPASPTNKGILTLTGEDIGVILDQEEKIIEHPAQNDAMIVAQTLKRYTKYNIFPQITQPPLNAVPSVKERTPIQHATDWMYLTQLAKLYNFIFYIDPQPKTFTNIAYWGPSVKQGVPTLKPFLYNKGSLTNVSNLNFSYDSLAAKKIITHTLDQDNKIVLIESNPKRGSHNFPSSSIRKRILKNSPGLNYDQLKTAAKAATELAEEQILSISGELDTARYGQLLQTRAFVSLKGTGTIYDKTYYIEKVHHILKRGTYKQKFNLKEAP